tara:strand:+ start:1981 stop:2139 length:159 start_codon:yes stop_codon:yes gene_type:complete
VCATVALRNIIGVTEDILLISVIPLKRHFHTNAVIISGFEMKHLINRSFRVI